MAQDEQHQWIVPTQGANTLPVIEILTGRGFITGKSGSGKSNTASVIAEQLLENNYNIVIVDPEGEYYGLKEKYELLHVGNDELCDAQVTASEADQLAEIALERNMPVILDVSGYLDANVSRELIASTVRALFQKEKEAQKPLLLLVEEMQEYLPQQGGSDELGELLERVAKRGRKRGLGMLGISQRPSSVDKDFITQCDWMVWHRLTWQNDIEVVRKVLGADRADEVEDLDTGEGFLMTDWDESVERVQFKQKQTHDAGATPGLESYDRPDLTTVSSDLIREIEGASVDSPAADGARAVDSDAAPDMDPDALDSAVDSVADSGAAESPWAQSTEEEPIDSEMLDEDSASEPATDPTHSDLDALSEAELREAVESLERRNQILEDEVLELRSILQNVDTASSGETSSATAEQDSGDTVTVPKTPPSKPVPPEPPEDRVGIAGNLVEMVYMVGYLLKVLVYRIRLQVYERRAESRRTAAE